MRKVRSRKKTLQSGSTTNEGSLEVPPASNAVNAPVVIPPSTQVAAAGTNNTNGMNSIVASNRSHNINSTDGIGVIGASAALPNNNTNNNNNNNTNNNQAEDKKPISADVQSLTAKNYRLARELADLRARHREEIKTVSRLTMENVSLNICNLIHHWYHDCFLIMISILFMFDPNL
jgi:hypothetical protein